MTVRKDPKNLPIKYSHLVNGKEKKSECVLLLKSLIMEVPAIMETINKKNADVIPIVRAMITGEFLAITTT